MRERLGIAAVVALAIVNIFLVPRALEQGRGNESAPAPTPQAQQKQQVKEPGPSEPASPTPESSEVVLDDDPTLMTARGEVVIQAERGRCANEEPVGIVLSTDGGRSFAPVRVGPKLTAVTALRATEGAVEVVGADAQCEPVALRTIDGGRTWEGIEPPSIWRLAARPDEERVLTPEGSLDTPCTPVALSSEGDAVVRVLCDDGRLLGIEDTTWVVLGRLEGASAIRYPTPARGFAIAPGRGCARAVFGTDDGGDDWTQLTCLQDAERPGAVAGQDGRYVARGGGATLASTDGGETWTRL